MPESLAALAVGVRLVDLLDFAGDRVYSLVERKAWI
jgi:hypothetical protein